MNRNLQVNPRPGNNFAVYYDVIVKDGVETKAHATIGMYPMTANCQLNIVYNAAGVLNEDRLTTDEKRNALKTMSSYQMRPLILLDLNKSVADIARTIYTGEQVIMDSPYKSSNGSEMVIMIVRA